MPKNPITKYPAVIKLLKSLKKDGVNASKSLKFLRARVEANRVTRPTPYGKLSKSGF